MPKSKISNSRPSHKQFLLVFILFFAAIGGWVLYRSHAASVVAGGTLQVEKMSFAQGSGAIAAEATASGGKSMVVKNSGSLRGTIIVTPASSYNYRTSLDSHFGIIRLVSTPTGTTSATGTLSLIGRTEGCSNSSYSVSVATDGKAFLNSNVNSASWHNYQTNGWSPMSSGSPISGTHSVVITYSPQGQVSSSCSLHLDMVSISVTT